MTGCLKGLAFCFLLLLLCAHVQPVVLAQESSVHTIVQENDQQDAPRIFLPESRWDFGKVIDGNTVRHKFVVKNTGSTDLVIERVRTSCGCAVAQLGKSVLKPGESTPLTIEFDSTGRSGPQEKQVYIRSNDPENPFATITILADVALPPAPRIAMESEMLDIGAVETGTAPIREVFIENTGSEPLSVSDFRTGSMCSVKLVPDQEIAPGGKAVLRVIFDTLSARGLVEQFVTMTTNDPLKGRVTLRIIGYVYGSNVPLMEMVPEAWDFGIVDPSVTEDVTKTFLVFNTGRATLEVTGITVPPGFEVSEPMPVLVEPDSSQPITIGFTASEMSGTVKCSIFVYSNDAQRPTRKVIMYGYISSSGSR